MSKPEQKIEPKQESHLETPKNTPQVGDVPADFYPRDSRNHIIKPERFCPICWNRFKGYGTKGTTTERDTGYYKCNRTLPSSEFGPCGFSWSYTWEQVESIRNHYDAQMREMLVTHREVVIKGKR